jgi:hypothetical protein
MMDLDEFSYFLGISVTRSPTGMLLSQRQYAIDLLHHARMIDCNPCATPIDTRCKLSADEVSLLSDPTEYQSFAGPCSILLPPTHITFHKYGCIQTHFSARYVRICEW